MRLLPILAVLVLAGCGTESGQPGPRPGSDQLPAEVLAFNPDGAAHDTFVTISDEPFHWPAFLGWWGGDDPGSDLVADEPGMTYVAATGMTGCRAPEGVRVTRSGPDLTVEFTGGVDHENCFRAVGPSVLLALRSADMEGVRSVNGHEPQDPAGPGRLTEFVPLGAGLDLAESGHELGLDPLYASLEAAGANNLAEARAALEAPVPAGAHGYAFVAAGCAETGAALVIGDPITVELTGGEDTDCDAPAYFLATFEVPAEYVPEGAVPGVR